MYDLLRSEEILKVAKSLLKTDEISVHGIFNARPMLPNTPFTRALGIKILNIGDLIMGKKG